MFACIDFTWNKVRNGKKRREQRDSILESFDLDCITICIYFAYVCIAFEPWRLKLAYYCAFGSDRTKVDDLHGWNESLHERHDQIIEVSDTDFKCYLCALYEMYGMSENEWKYDIYVYEIMYVMLLETCLSA